MDESKPQKNTVFDSFLKTYSIKDIALLFSKINHRLISLHRLSAKDFLQLNHNFKDIYYKSVQISKELSEVCNVFIPDKNQNLSQGVNSLYQKLKTQFESQDHKIIAILDLIENLSVTLNHLFIPLKNYNHNLKSLNYVMVNSNVSLSYQDSFANDKTEKDIVKVERLFDRIKVDTDNLLIILIQLSEKANSTLRFIKGLKSKREAQLEKLLSEIYLSIDILDIKNKENKKNILQIKNRIDNIHDFGDKIIKNLQYEDIIKQKMEHVQKTHLDLIHELNQLNLPLLEKNRLNAKATCFMRIGDLSRLQAAQLIQTNKEYQSAIEVISDNFILIGNNLTEITKKSEQVYSSRKINDDFFFENIDTFINKANVFIDKCKQQDNIINEEINHIYHKLQKSEKQIQNYLKYAIAITHLRLKDPEFIEKNLIVESEPERSNILYSQLLNETKDKAEKIIVLFNQLFSLKGNLAGVTNLIGKDLWENVDLNEYQYRLKSIKNLYEKFDPMIIKNKQNAKKVNDKIINSISKIEYYDNFEKVIQDLITELNTFHFRLKQDDRDQLDSKETNLEKLTEYYTMQSERLIHEKVSKEKDADIDFEITEDDEIEFFNC